MTGRRRRRLAGAALLLGAAAAAGIWSSCGGGELNLFRPAAKPLALRSDLKAELEQARVDLDAKKYGDALNLLQPIIADPGKDSNDARVLYAAATLGNAGFDLWDVISKLLASLGAGSGSPTDSGLSDLLNAIDDSVLGTGAERTAHVQALYSTIDALQNAPNPSDPDVSNVSCIVAAFLAVPTIGDATDAMTEMTSALQQIASSAQSGGTVCPDIGALNAASASLSTAVSSFDYILKVAGTCSFLNLNKTKAQMNNIEQALSTLMEHADKGCASVPKCPAAVPDCQSLFPACVQQVLQVGTSAAKAGDGVLDPCEIVLNCTDPTECFQGF